MTVNDDDQGVSEQKLSSVQEPAENGGEIPGMNIWFLFIVFYSFVFVSVNSKGHPIFVSLCFSDFLTKSDLTMPNIFILFYLFHPLLKTICSDYII